MELQNQNEIVLIDTLRNIWENYANAAEEQDVKQHWLQLFLFHFQYVNDEILQKPHFKSFFNPIPEEICSFLLEKVYEIISKSEYYNPTQLGIEISLHESDNDALSKSISSKDVAKLLKKNHNFAQLILRAPTDCNKIVTLRTFLTNQFGHRLLEFLLKININLIASQKSICNLCINLFPNCPWSNDNNFDLKKSNKIFKYIGRLQLFQKPNVALTTCLHAVNLNNTKSEIFQEERPDAETDLLSNDDIEQYKNCIKSSDEIAYLLIKLLIKCVANECDTLLTDQSMSIITMNFALDSLCVASDTFGSAANAEIIKLKLLQLIEHCLNNLFANERNINALQLQYIIARLVAALETNKQQTLQPESKTARAHILFGLNLIIFGVLNNIVAMYGNSENNAVGNSRTNLYTTKFIDETVIDLSVKIFNELLQQHKQLDFELQILCAMIFKTLLKIIDTICKYDQLVIQCTTTNFDGSIQQHAKPPRRKKLYLHQMHCRPQLEMDTKILSCFFQGLLLDLLPNVPSELQDNGARFLLRAGTCCCHYTLKTIATCFHLVPKAVPSVQKSIYKFISRKLLNTLYVRAPMPQTSANNTKQNTPNCSKCDAKLKSLEFHSDMLALYRQLYERLYKLNEKTALILFLKHLKHISLLLTNGIAAGVLAEIVLPIFRHYKATLLSENVSPPMNENECKRYRLPARGRCNSLQTAEELEKSKKTARNFSDHSNKISTGLHINIPSPSTDSTEIIALKIIHECLNIFVIYLSDIRLIKAFYNEENIKHLEDLLTYPEVIRGICDLIKIGIDNITFLGDNSQEQTALSRRLITLQLNSSDRASQLFSALLCRFANCSKINKHDFWLDDTASGTRKVQNSVNLKPLEILHISALQWSLNYELLKTSQFFYNEFAKIYSIPFENDDEVTDNNDDEAAATKAPNTYAAANLERKDLSKSIYLKHGDKTIHDILKLNYNALCSFLMLPSRKKVIPAKSTSSQKNLAHIFTLNSSPLNSPTTAAVKAAENKQIDCLSSSLETLISSIDYAAASMQNSISSTSTSTVFGCDNNAVDELAFDSSYYDSVTQFYTEAINETFLQKLEQQQQHKSLECHPSNDLLTESIVLFDIRNQKQAFIQQVPPQNQNVLNSSTEEALATVLPNSETLASSPNNDGGILSKLFNMFGSFFGASRSNSLYDLNEGKSNEKSPRVDEVLLTAELQEFCELNGDCKKLLLKLFEATMAICIKGFQNEEVEKMQKHLRKLKTLIISNASENWQQHSEEHARTQNTITQALQTLLKIAELSSSVNEPVGILGTADEVFVSTPTTSTAATATATATISATAVTATHELRSCARTSRRNTGGVDVFCPTLLTPTLLSSPTTQRCRPQSGDSTASTTDFDYFSTRGASIICPDSELEFSEHEHDEFYLTADEGYEADAEIPEVTDTDAELEAVDLWNSFQPPSSRYRSHVLHSGLCQLVVDILIELSQLCTLNPVGWCDHLAQLANRLFVIREYLGGPLFLLRGFAPVLECNDVRLRELQQSILELIMDLNTPNVLATFFSILSSKNPPVDLLMKYMSHICASAIKTIQPSTELEFPIAIDGKCVSTSIPYISAHIDQVRNYHLHSQATTPFTRAPIIIPITHTKLWTNDGFTLSLWVQLKSAPLHKSNSQLMDDDTRSAADECLKSHLISIGSNQAMLSIYINSNMNLVFETCKPNAELKLPPQHSDDAATYEINTPTNATTAVINPTSPTDSNKSKANCSPTNAYVSNNSPFRNVLKETKLVLLRGFNHMHFFNGHTGIDGGDGFYEGSSIDLKYHRMSRNKWTHLTFAVDTLPDCLNLTVFIDGLEQHTISLPFRNLRNLTRTYSFQLITLGDGFSAKPITNQSSNYTTESRSTIDGYPLRTSISNLMLFNRKITIRESIFNLTAMGPDFNDLTQCQVDNWKPNYGYLNISKMYNSNFGNFGEALKLLKDSHILTYAAQQPDVVLGNETNIDVELGSYGHHYGLILYGLLQQNHLQSLQTSTILCGGLSAMLYLFARVVETSNNSVTQSMALDLLLGVALSETQLYTEFQRNDYVSLIGFVIKTERCTKDIQLLRSIVNNACSQPLIVKRTSDNQLHVNENTIASLIYPRLFISILHRYSIWHRSGAEHSHVLDMHLRCILALTREKHPHKEFNMEQLNKAGILKEMLNLCKVYVIESPHPVYISKDAAESFVSILSVFAGSPPSPSLMDEIMKLLLLLHKPSECYITHDRSKFYFLLKSQPPPAKEKLTLTTTNLSRVAAPFRRSFGRGSERRPGVAVAATTSTNDADASRTARINKLRKLHAARSSPYKRVLQEFEENLENIADCSRLNKNAFRMISPVEAANWRSKFKRQANMEKTVSSTGSPKKASSPKSVQRSIRKRNNLRTTNATHLLFPSADSDEAQRRRSSTRNSDSSFQSLAAASLKAFGIDVNTAEDAMTSSSTQKRLKSLVKIDFYGSAGIIALQEGLFKLLKNFLCLLPDSYVEDVLRHYVKVEFLLVLSNHNSCAVRTAIIKLLAALTKRITTNDLQNLIKNYYPQHLGNQLSIHPTDVYMFEACLEWVNGHYGKLKDFNNYDCVHIQNRFGLNALLAILTKAPINQNDFTAKAFEILNEIYVKDTEENPTLIECGLLQCCMKVLYNIYTKTNVMNSKTEQAIVELLTTIGKKCLKSVGHMNIIWDILNMLSFYQDREPANVVKGFRSIQGQLQLNWINMYFKKPLMPHNFNVTVQPDSTLSLSETKTRLDLLIDRCSQFFTVFDANYTPSENEIVLFELLVTYGISTNQRCNNFIAWGLQPSRPHALRSFIINVLWTSCQDEFLPSIICDGKMIKSLLWLCLLEDLPEPIANLSPLCQYLGINESDSTWNLENELSRIELNRCNISAKQKSLLEKTVYKFESLAVCIIESSMLLTRRVAELQNSERKLIMSHMKDYDETHTYAKWLEIIRRMTHEGAPWYSKDYAENSWELDDTEGPSRVHTRLRRCHLDIDKRFIMEDYRSTNSNKQNVNKSNNSSPAATATPFTTSSDDYYTRPLDYLLSSYDQQLNISLNSQILYNFPAKYLPVDGEIDGEVIVTDHKLYFLATYHCKYFNVSCDISNITEIWLKRYQHQEKAFEIFLDTNQSLFFSLQNQDDWKIMKEVFCDKIVTPADQNKILAITQQWREGVFTNWEYLMTLNQIAGRTYNDLMQYPVFPWILSNYTVDVLDLSNRNNFRKLEKPIAVQLEENEQHYINNYTYINNTMTNMGSMILKPYHYSSHYSNSGTVLHFLVRVPPFTSYFLRYQDNNFDLADRTFHALGTTWCLASRDSPTDVKELIPEFFCLPEMFENFERFNFGCRQNGERVEDVTLPTWCARDPRLFVLIHRQALESETVRNNLHQWIDLIFGYKQTGENAVDAINVFHPATYSVFMESEISDPIERKAVETMIKTYGQMPRQLFKNAHPASKMLNYNPSEKEIMTSVRGLRWGVYVGSPQLPKPRLGNIYKLAGAENIFSLSSTNVVYGLPAKSCIMQGAEADTFNVVFWGHEDHIVRIQPLNKTTGKPKNLLNNYHFDDITTCGADPNSNQLWCGHRSGRISVYKCSSMDASQRNGKSRQSYVHSLRLSYNSAFRKITTKSSSKMDADVDGGDAPSSSHSNSSLAQREGIQKDGADLDWSGPTVLVRHTDEITCICLSVEFKIAVSAGRDGIAVIWDLNNWSYVRTIERPAEIHHSPITRIAISSTLGDIVTVHTIPLHSSNIHKTQTSNGSGSSNEEIDAVKSVTATAAAAADECFEVTEENLDDFVNVSINPNGKSIIRLHSVNARYIQHILNDERVLAVCYSYIKEGVGVNVIATALDGGLVRLWSSWNLSFVTDIITGISNIKSLTYSTHQHLVVLTEDSKIQVWETDSLTGNSPKFPQIAFK